MLIINQTIYDRLASELCDEIDSQGFYSGCIDLEYEQISCHFSATLLIYYSIEKYPEGCESRISDVVPVWWEFHTYIEGEQRLNDFDFNLLKEVICS